MEFNPGREFGVLLGFFWIGAWLPSLAAADGIRGVGCCVTASRESEHHPGAGRFDDWGIDFDGPGPPAPPGDSNDASDAELERKIGESVLASESLTRRARQVVVVARQGVVVLTGTVADSHDREVVENLARAAGALRVENRIEVDDDVAEGTRGGATDRADRLGAQL